MRQHISHRIVCGLYYLVVFCFTGRLSLDQSGLISLRFSLTVCFSAYFQSIRKDLEFHEMLPSLDHGPYRHIIHLAEEDPGSPG
jgi:hypothetical protein